MTDKPSGVSKRGFASMDKERQLELARLGGASVRKENRTFSKDRELARTAGAKGGSRSARKKKP